MPLKRAYDQDRNTVVVTLMDAYKDRLSRWSDIQEYMPFLYEQAAIRKKPAIGELGTRKGNSTLAFLAGAMCHGGHVWSADIDDARLHPDGMMPWRNVPSWTFIHGDSRDPGVVAQFPELDILFNDAGHEYQATLDECRLYVPLVKPGGIALFHDTRWAGEVVAGQPAIWDGSDKDYPPVRKALDDYCAETGLTWKERPGKYFGLGVIEL